MPRLPEYFNIGEKDNLTTEFLLEIIQRMYTDLSNSINQKPDLYQRPNDGLTTDTFLSNGSININTSTLKVEMLTSHPTATTVTWTQLS